MTVAKKMYPTVEGRCKDYVMYPKPNGYQSLHSTHEASVSPGAAAAADGERHTHFELQVRSASMHHKAEYGHAAHWSYKSDGKDEEEEGEDVETASERRTWKSYERPMATGTRSQRRSRSKSTAAAVPDSVSSGRELVTWLHLELRQRKVRVCCDDRFVVCFWHVYAQPASSKGGDRSGLWLSCCGYFKALEDDQYFSASSFFPFSDSVAICLPPSNSAVERPPVAAAPHNHRCLRRLC